MYVITVILIIMLWILYYYTRRPLQLYPIKKINVSDVNEESYHSGSGSMVRDGDGYLFNVRYLNNYYENGKQLKPDNPTTINKCFKLDKKLNVVHRFDLDTNFMDAGNFKGIEDIRLYRDDKLRFIGSAETNGAVGIVHGEYNTNFLMGSPVQPDFENRETEKNWVFFDYLGETKVVYKWYPLTIASIQGSVLQKYQERKTPQFFENFRGSSCGVTVNNEIWFIIHEAKDSWYMHRVVVFDRRMNLLRYSDQFTFEGNRIEYCLSLIVEDNRVIIPYSIFDKSTIIGVYDRKYIESLLHHI